MIIIFFIYTKFMIYFKNIRQSAPLNKLKLPKNPDLELIQKHSTRNVTFKILTKNKIFYIP
ncbi:MAG: hypothetical protein ACD_3C00226G0004 [uncultured bacterium (gcode 4)]|uniref:Uncharacterized protein n=1 Tax=uncultured bacterium (gcode 4) TaxID=1234023 RepID=K2GVE1_9BACT|nr:MAG: hypothetical protein ACD_3C00226G0004 [uncultured bacterium (gcode 4)]